MRVPEFMAYTSAEAADMTERARSRYVAAETQASVADFYVHAASDAGVLLMRIDELEYENADLESALDLANDKIAALMATNQELVETYRKRTQSLAEMCARFAQSEKWLNDALAELDELRNGRAA